MKIRLGVTSLSAKAGFLIVDIQESLLFEYKGHHFAVAQRMAYPSLGIPNGVKIFNKPKWYSVYHYASGREMKGDGMTCYSKSIKGAEKKFIKNADRAPEEIFNECMNSLAINKLNEIKYEQTNIAN